MIRVAVPQQLRTLAGIGGEVRVDVGAPVTVRTVLDAVEAAHPQLRGTIRDPSSGRRRAFIRLFADGEDYSEKPPDAPLPDSVADGRRPLQVVGAIAGG